MEDYGPETFGELNAEKYDILHDPGTTDQAVDLVGGLARGKKTLELAIGTGRIALPLSLSGIEIHGLDASPKMLAKLKEKPGGEKIPVTVADMADFELEDRFEFAFLVFNTLFNLQTQDAQVQCFQNVARHLEDGARFLVETYVPDVTTFVDGQHMRTRYIGPRSVAFEAAKHDPVNQVINYQIIRMSNEGFKVVPLPTRYAWPQEIDLMARCAGLELETRWGGWDQRKFTADSKMHISIYRKSI